jgi:hypothetical protein
MRKILEKAVFVGVITIFLAFPAMGWDDVGHKITGYIAWQRMSPEVREKVIKILLAAPEDSQIPTFFAGYGSRSLETRRREYFMLMAYWPDIVRDKLFENRFKKYHNGTWHYSNVFWTVKDRSPVPVEGLEPAGLALQKIDDFSKLIRSTATDAEKAIAISWLEHLIGDIHQPLHISAKVSDFNPKGDQGGNLFLLTPKGTPRDKQENLHWFWDSILAAYQPNTKELCDADYLDPIAQGIMRLYPYEKLKDTLAPDRVDIWAKESLEISQKKVFKDIRFFEKPSDKYKKMAFETAQERIALAGYRMAALFNEAFSAPATTTTPAAK